MAQNTTTKLQALQKRVEELEKLNVEMIKTVTRMKKVVESERESRKKLLKRVKQLTLTKGGSGGTIPSPTASFLADKVANWEVVPFDPEKIFIEDWCVKQSLRTTAQNLTVGQAMQSLFEGTPVADPKMDVLLCGLIMKCLDGKAKQWEIAANTKSATVLWAKLKEAYTVSDEQQVKLLKERLANLTFDAAKPFPIFQGQVQYLQEKLKKIDPTHQDNLFKRVILRKLPLSRFPLKQTWMDSTEPLDKILEIVHKYDTEFRITEAPDTAAQPPSEVFEVSQDASNHNNEGGNRFNRFNRQRARFDARGRPDRRQGRSGGRGTAINQRNPVSRVQGQYFKSKAKRTRPRPTSTAHKFTEDNAPPNSRGLSTKHSRSRNKNNFNVNNNNNNNNNNNTPKPGVLNLNKGGRGGNGIHSLVDEHTAVYAAGEEFDQLNDSISSLDIVCNIEGCTQPSEWLVDSGASGYYANDDRVFTDLHMYPPQQRRAVGLAGQGLTVPVLGEGTVILNLKDSKGHNFSVKLAQVKFAPKLRHCYFSTSSHSTNADGSKSGNSFIDGPLGPLLTWGENHVPCREQGNRRWLDVVSFGPGEDLMSLVDVPEVNDLGDADGDNNIEGQTLQLLHQRLGHPNARDLKLAALRGEIKLKTKEMEACRSCFRGKAKALPKPPRSKARADKPFAFTHLDICGPFLKSQHGSVWAFLYLDDYSRYATVFTGKSKDMVSKTLEQYAAWVKTRGGFPDLPVIYTDNAVELKAGAFKEMADKLGLTLRQSPSHNLAHHGRLEHYVGVVKAITRTLLSHSLRGDTSL